MKLPTKWSDVTVDKFILLKDINKNSSIIEMQVDLISIFTDIEDDVINKMDVLEFVKYTDKFNWLQDPLTTDFYKEIDDLYLIPNNKITLGEFIDLDYYFTEDMFKYLPNICATLYKRNDDTKEGPEYYKDIPITEVYGLLGHFLDFKLNIENNYKTILTQAYDEEDDISLLSQEEQEELKKELAEEAKQKKWAWEILLYKLSGGDVTKYEALFDKQIIFIFNHLSFLKEFNLEV